MSVFITGSLKVIFPSLFGHIMNSTVKLLISEVPIVMLLLNIFYLLGVLIISNIVYGHAYISGTKKDLLVFILRNIKTFNGSRVSAKLGNASIIISEQFNTQDMRIKGLDAAFICFDDHDIALFNTNDPNAYSIYCTFEREWYVNANTISKICRKNNVSIEINVEDPGRYFMQHIFVNHTGKILSSDDIDYYSEDSLFQKQTGKSKYSNYFLMQGHYTNVFCIEDIEIEFFNSLLNPKLASVEEHIIEKENSEPCEMCGKPVTYGYSLCDSCDETVNYMRDDGIYIY